MTVKHVVVDGSNLATEGRALPSLQQLDEAVRAYLEQYKPENITVIVDASFPNRIDPSERAAFEGALTAGELITPPAGVIGRGDAFLLQIADRIEPDGTITRYTDVAAALLRAIGHADGTAHHPHSDLNAERPPHVVTSTG